jgi:AcrR family transcriptional regulator
MRGRPQRETLDGNEIRTRRTRARILDGSLQLFNERGEARVATGHIAASLGMSPGNLYYHFRNKDQIVEELFARFEERVDLGPGPAAAPAHAVENLWLYLHLLLESVWEYRFLYRNLDDIVSRNRRLSERFSRILEGQSRALSGLLLALSDAGALQASPEERAALAANLLVVATFWLEYDTLSRRGSRTGAPQLGQGAYQVMSMAAPYLAGDARRHFEQLARHYLD